MLHASSIRTLTAAALLGVAGTAHAQAPSAPTSQLTPGMTVKLLLMDELKSGAVTKGQRVNFRVDENVVDGNGNVLIRQGTPAYGSVTETRKNGMFGKRGLLNIAADYTITVDGQKVALRATQANGGKSNTGWG